MCGIVGINSECDLAPVLESMSRGNDDKSIYEDSDVQLGFVRHTIVDTGNRSRSPFQHGHQVSLANGELFNFEEIAKSIGLSEYSNDLEVLHHYLLQKGVYSFPQLNTMLAGAVWDTREKILYLLRDWVGEMPLHYFFDPKEKRWAFSSDIASMLRMIPGISPLEDVHEVPPGSILEINNEEGTLTKHSYFDITKTDRLEEDADYDQCKQELRNKLEKSAQERSFFDAPHCVLISGGIDSLITTHLLLKNRKQESPLPAYTFHCSDFPEDENSDLYHARKVVQWLGNKVDHRVVYASAEQIKKEIFPTIYSLEDTRGRDFNVFTALYNRFLAERIRKDGIRLVYEGEGPDEALGAYSAWRKFEFTDEEIGDPLFRKKMISNLSKGVLLRTSKVMMNFGPLECRSFFLDRDVMTFLSSLPANIVRKNGHKKSILIDAFKDDIPEELLTRLKTRPQDSTGITSVLENYMEAQKLDFREILLNYFKNIGI